MILFNKSEILARKEIGVELKNRRGINSIYGIFIEERILTK
jgi:hypothetical protein